MKKTTLLKQLINQSDLSFLMEAHNGCSAKIVERAGFKGVWASGLSISAALGVRDSNEASWTQILEVCEFMSDQTQIPILLDGDTGYGNFNNVRRLIQKLEQRNIAGVCIEDKCFPKTNSFIGNKKQPLASLNEMTGKIKAAKDSQIDNDFVLVARTETFIAGGNVEQALERASAYKEAGADAILVHSKKETSIDVDEFMNAWHEPCPIIIVPTKYYKTPTQHFRDIDISTVIWANHNLRAAVMAMENLSKQLFESESLVDIEKQVADLNTIFEIQNVNELIEAEKIYLPKI